MVAGIGPISTVSKCRSRSKPTDINQPFDDWGKVRRWAEQIVRFARSNVLFYDKHVIDLSHRICAQYRDETETREKPDSNLSVSAQTKTSRETHFALGDISAKGLENKDFPMVGAPGLEPGTR